MFQSLKKYFISVHKNSKVRPLSEIIASLESPDDDYELVRENEHFASQIRNSEHWRAANLDRISLGRGIGRW